MDEKHGHDDHALPTRFAQLETKFDTYSRQTTTTLETIGLSITESNRRAEENERLFRESIDRLAGEWFNRLDASNKEFSAKFEQRKPNWAAIAGFIFAIIIPSATLVGYSVKSGTAPIAERQNLLLRDFYAHESLQRDEVHRLDAEIGDLEANRTSHMDDRQDSELRELRGRIERLQSLIDWRPQKP